MAVSGKRALVCLDDFEKYARDVLPESYTNYYTWAAERGVTATDNKEAFRRYQILPRILEDVSQRDLTTTVLGHHISLPVCISPAALMGLAHPDAEKAVARGSEAMGTVYIQSTSSNCSLEEVADAAPSGLRFLQLYVFKERAATLNLVRTAERLGVKALVLTVDQPVLPAINDFSRSSLECPPHLRLPNYPGAFKVMDYDSSILKTNAAWSDVMWLKSVTCLPLILKGILTPEAARKAVECGVNGILVSNHGGRVLDTIPSTLDALPGVIDAVDGRCEVYVDGGFRFGTDVFKGLALGARAVFIGRPIIYGLCYNGADGVKQILDIMKNELATTMALAGCSSVKDIKRNLVVHKAKYISLL